MSVDDFDSGKLADLSPEEAVLLFRSLLWCAARRAGIPTESVTITTNVDVADGGIDAEILPNAVTPKQCALAAGNSFFQIKAGTSAAPWQRASLHKELFGQAKQPSKKALGEAVLHCLKQKGRYVIVCFGCDPSGNQRRQARRHLREFFAAAGFKRARVDVWGQSTLAGLMHPFPSLTLQLTDRHHLPFLTYDDWRLDAQMTPKLHLGEPQLQMIEVIRSKLRRSKSHHLRIVGEPGLGKTRVLLDALAVDDLSATVLYFRDPEDFERGPLFNALLRSGDDSWVTLVIDDCPPRERASIWSVLKNRSDRVRLITLDQGPETSTDEWMKVIECPMLAREQIKAILADYIGSNYDLDRWAEFCSGSPRVAHAVGDNLCRNPSDILKSPAIVPVWDRYVHGNTRTGGPEESQRETVLRHVALFHKFGFEDPVTEEAKFIAALVERADPAVTWSRFQTIIKHFRDRRVLQGKTTLFLVPKALHIHLWLQFWDHYGTGTRITDLLNEMPPSLFRWFMEMFKYGHASPACATRIEQLTSHGGPFDEPTFITAGLGATFLNELAEAVPEATLACIERTIGTWPHDTLIEFRQSRQHIVWALETIAIWKDLFRRAAAMLLKLALAENATNTNNATGTFCGLFCLRHHRFASSEAPPEHRLPVLRKALEAVDPSTRVLALKASAAALAADTGMHMVGPEYQGIRPLPALWSPQKLGEVFDAYRAVWRLVAEFCRSSTGEDKQAASKVLIDAAFGLIQSRSIEAEVIDTLAALASDADTDLRLIVEFIARFRSVNRGGLSRKAAAALRAIDKQIYGDTVESRVTRVVLLGTFDDVTDSRRRPYGKAHSETVARLARAAYKDAPTLSALLPRLVSCNGFALPAFGFHLSNADSEHVWWPTILEAFIAEGNQRRPEFVAGYLSSLFRREPALWERTALALLRDDATRQYARSLIISSGLTERILDELCFAVQRGEVPEDTVASVGYAKRSYSVSTKRCTEFIEWCIEQGTPTLARIGVETAYLMFGAENHSPPLAEQPLLDLLTAPAVFDSDRRRQSHFQWAELTKQYVETYPQHAQRIFESVLGRFANFEFCLSFPHTLANAVMHDLIRRDPKSTWTAVAARLLPLNARSARHIARWLGPPDSIGDGPVAGPLALFEINDILAWIDVDPDNRARVIAAECPRSLTLGEGGLLTREILIRYGQQDEVRSVLCLAFETGYCGDASAHYRKRRDRMREWLATETAQQVIEWLQERIDYLGRRIKREEIREEREM